MCSSAHGGCPAEVSLSNAVKPRKVSGAWKYKPFTSDLPVEDRKSEISAWSLVQTFLLNYRKLFAFNLWVQSVGVDSGVLWI